MELRGNFDQVPEDLEYSRAGRPCSSLVNASEFLPTGKSSLPLSSAEVSRAEWNGVEWSGIDQRREQGFPFSCAKPRSPCGTAVIGASLRA